MKTATQERLLFKANTELTVYLSTPFLPQEAMPNASAAILLQGKDPRGFKVEMKPFYDPDTDVRCKDPKVRAWVVEKLMQLMESREFGPPKFFIFREEEQPITVKKGELYERDQRIAELEAELAKATNKG